MIIYLSLFSLFCYLVAGDLDSLADDLLFFFLLRPTIVVCTMHIFSYSNSVFVWFCTLRYFLIIRLFFFVFVIFHWLIYLFGKAINCKIVIWKTALYTLNRTMNNKIKHSGHIVLFKRWKFTIAKLNSIDDDLKIHLFKYMLIAYATAYSAHYFVIHGGGGPKVCAS